MLEGNLLPIVQGDAQIINDSIQFEDLDLKRLLAYELNDSTIFMYQRDCRVYVEYAYTEGLEWLKPSTLVEWRDHLNSRDKNVTSYN